MTTTPGISGSTPAAGPASPLGAGTKQLDRDTFLKLLVAQLKYQDPSKPVDSSEFIAQSAQFTMVEKLTELASAAKESAVAQRAATVSAYLGRNVVATGGDGREVTGRVTSVDMRPEGIVLRLGDTEVTLAAVTEVALATPPATAPTTANTTSDQEV